VGSPPQAQTFDNGREFARHEQIGKRLGLDVYFAHPYSPWERGTNENTNGLLRQYLPKSRSFADLTESELARYVWQLNHRPRKCLNYRTPDEVFHQRPVALRMRIRQHCLSNGAFWDREIAKMGFTLKCKDRKVSGSFYIKTYD